MKRNVIVGGLLIAFIGGVFAFRAWAIEPLRHQKPTVSSTKILDRNGGLLYEVSLPGAGVRTVIPYDSLPKSYVQALVSVEDARFYSHHGVDWIGNLRAIWEVVRSGHVVSGASTLEQQTVKNLFFAGAERSVIQKLREMVAAEYWAGTHTKEETIETYANAVSLGNNTIGIEAAAQAYFHKQATDLSVAESAMLAGMAQSPSQNDPYRQWRSARARQRVVLDRMVEEGVLTDAQRNEDLETGIDVFPPKHPIRAPHFVFRVLDELRERYPDLDSGGYVVRTTIDPDLQTAAEESISRRIFKLASQHVTDAAAVAIDPQSGELLAYVGSRDYFNDEIQGQVDMASALRQPGSALKPFLYFQAFRKGLTAATVIADLPVRFEGSDGRPYYPRNYGYKYFGPVTLREALGSSLNIPAVKVLDQIGIGSFISTLSYFGIHFPQAPDYYGLGIVLGGGEVTLMDATRAYASLALYAKSVDIVDVLEVTDAKGRVVEKRAPAQHGPIFDDANAAPAARLVTDILVDRLARSRGFGEANLLETGKEIAVKTGTTKDFRDNWAFGYTPTFALGVWVGNADNSPMEGVSGISGAVPIWNDLMQGRFRQDRKIEWPSVAGLVTRTICTTSGKLANDLCPKTRQELFLSGTEPSQADDWYTVRKIDASTGLLTADGCRGQVVEKIFLEPPAEYASWFRATGYELAPTQDCKGKTVVSGQQAVTIISPLDGDIFEQDSHIDPANRSIPFIAGGGEQSVYRWNLDGKVIESRGSTFLWEPKIGKHVLKLEGAAMDVQFHVK